MLKILISNDDGYDSPGLEVLCEHLKEVADLFVVAPEINNSGAGCSITTNRPLKATRHENGFISVNGRPADCVHLGIHELSPWKPDLVLSGINLGANMGEDLLYSGTVGAALEGRGLRYPSIAVSAAAFNQPGSENFLEPNNQTAALVIKEIIENYQSIKLDSSIVLNVNVPNVEYSKSLNKRVTRIGSWGKRNPPHKETKDNGNEVFWTTHRDQFPSNDKNTDISCLMDEEVSISPIIPNFSNDVCFKEVTKWIEQWD
jgi:5'-nucleotidase